MNMLRKFWHPEPENTEIESAEDQITLRYDPLTVLKPVNDRFYGYLMGMNSLVESPLNGLETSVLRLLDKLISQNITATLIPRLPAVLPKIMQQLRSDNYEAKNITELISTDAVLTIEILRLVNSPFFSTTQQITDLNHAVAHLGQNGLRELMMAVAMKPIMQIEKGFFYKQAAKLTWEQALKAAIACRNLANDTGTDNFEAYLSGLMHNTGVMIVLRQLDQIPDMLEAPHSVEFQHRSEVFVYSMSYAIACYWELSDHVLLALEDRANAKYKRPSSSIGQILEMGVCLAQIHTLSKLGRCKESTENLKLLTRQPYGGNAVRVYEGLDRYQQTSP